MVCSVNIVNGHFMVRFCNYYAIPIKNIMNTLSVQIGSWKYFTALRTLLTYVTQLILYIWQSNCNIRSSFGETFQPCLECADGYYVVCTMVVHVDNRPPPKNCLHYFGVCYCCYYYCHCNRSPKGHWPETRTPRGQ